MSKTNEQNLRDRYFSNDIFKLGEIVEDTNTGEKMKILDRGSNYVTVASEKGIVKKWLNQIIETVAEIPANKVAEIDESANENKVAELPAKDPNFELTESGQIKIFGYETRNFDVDTSEFVIEQFSEFKDLYSQHQIIKCLDFALHEDDLARRYDLIEKVEGFYAKQNLPAPLLVEVIKNDTERTRIAEILATVAGISVVKSNNSQTVTNSVKALKEKYQTKKQWEVLMPFLKLAREAGLPGAVQNLPYNVNISEEEMRDQIVLDVFEENIDLIVTDLEYDDIAEAFEESDFSDITIEEGLSIETRHKLAVKLKQHAPQLEIRRERALNKSASSSVLMQRARRLAETMMKRRLFHKPVEQMTRQEKERFESGAGKRKALIAKLATRLVGKVRALQSARLHHQNTPVSHAHDHALEKIAKAGAS